MNKLDKKARVLVLNMLCEGISMRAVSRLADVSINTVSKLLVDAGLACARFCDETVRNVTTKRVQCDEIWSYNYAKHKNVNGAKAAPERAGDVWTWTAIDSDSKMILSYLCGDRDADYALALRDDLQRRLANRVQLTTDGYKPYLRAAEKSFGIDVDYGMLVKLYGEGGGGSAQSKYSPPPCIGARRDVVMGEPDKLHISTSHAERFNLLMRIHMRRYTRLTNDYSKKFENHCHIVALYTVWSNFVRMNCAVRMSPAMAAGVAKSFMSIPRHAKRGPYKKRGTVPDQ